MLIYLNCISFLFYYKLLCEKHRNMAKTQRIKVCLVTQQPQLVLQAVSLHFMTVNMLETRKNRFIISHKYRVVFFFGGVGGCFTGTGYSIVCVIIFIEPEA